MQSYDESKLNMPPFAVSNVGAVTVLETPPRVTVPEQSDKLFRFDDKSVHVVPDPE
jgi:hypothetical protein